MSAIGGDELLRSAGLLVDGPARWPGNVPAHGPGIFIVELATPVAQAPIDYDAVRRWLDRVPSLTLDGERPSPRQLMARLADFWLPEAQIVFVGRGRRAIGSRVAAMQATPLGDARPSADGYWLKTLKAPMRVWWAETDAGEEYEDELLNQFSTSALPFANLGRPTGDLKAHGIGGALLEAAASKTAARRPGGASGPAGGSARAQPKPRRPLATAKRLGPPAAAPAYVSPAGVAEMTAELDNLRNNVRPGVIERVKTARELGDLRENSDYQAARNEQSFVEGRIRQLEAVLRTAVVVEAVEETGAVHVGSTVVVETDGDQVTWQVVGSGEADPARGRISYESPVGKALLGRRAGEEVIAELPRGQLRLIVREVR